MEIITIEKSLTGRYYFRSDTGLLWLGGKREAEAIADFLRLDKFNPSQPRDARGRFSRVAGTGGGVDIPLHKQKVADLQKRLEEAGVNPNTLSHKARKSVLIAAIETHGKGESLREAGLLKPTKNRTARQAKPRPAPKPASVLRMNGENAVATHDRQEFKNLYKQWQSSDEVQQIVVDYVAKRNELDAAKNYFERLKTTLPETQGKPTEPKDFAKLPSWLVLPQEAIQANRKSQEPQDSWEEDLFSEEDHAVEGKHFRFAGALSSIATVRENVKKGSFSVSLPNKTYDFVTRSKAESFARDQVKAIAAANYVSGNMVAPIRQMLENNQDLKLLEDQLKAKGIKDTSRQNIATTSDNLWIRRSLSESARERGIQVVAVQDKQGNLQSALTYRFVNSRSKSKGAVSIEYLATSPWNASKSEDSRSVAGAGARAIAEAVRISQAKGFDGRVKLYAIDGAVPFYEKLGFVKNEEGDHVLSSEKAKELLAKYG